jgi:tetratricopeptide (TPR) repeat protein
MVSSLFHVPTNQETKSEIILPQVPQNLSTQSVAAWRENVVIDTYEPLAPETFPMFFENRVYQGSSGKIYPLPFYNRISQEKAPREWDAIHMENKFLRLMILPELGGRIHIGFDKSANYDFFYRNDVIKPALVGLAGPWISGGVEFNWPQHHRPGTFSPTDIEIENHEDGSVTVWCSDHDPLHRMKGMHGVTIFPDSSLIELRVRLHNNTEDIQTFLWWANMAASVNDHYQSFFPQDVTMVADHARRAVTGFPRATSTYYGINYPSRVSNENPDADRLDLFRNIPVPTSYMCVDSKGDFLGGYDHEASAGFVHWADHRISPGKKQWTWGNDAFGKAWDRNLTDDNGPYIELMAGVYTDNQPDFSFLSPGETKIFSHYVYPIQQIGPVKVATRDVAINFEGPSETKNQISHENRYFLGIAVTKAQSLEITLEGRDGNELWARIAYLEPGKPFVEDIVLDATSFGDALVLIVRGKGKEIIRYNFGSDLHSNKSVQVATEPEKPEEVATVEELFLIGKHLSQYRHATSRPERYWREALRRDPIHSGSLIALAALEYSKGNFEESKDLLIKSISRLTSFNGNPSSGEAHYRLGLAYAAMEDLGLAFDAFSKAAWDFAWRSASYFAMARICCLSSNWEESLRLLDECLLLNAVHLEARNLRALVLKQLNRNDEAEKFVEDTITLDPLDWWARDIAHDEIKCDARTQLDIVIQYSSAGFLGDAKRVLLSAFDAGSREPFSGLTPLLHYYLAWLEDLAGDPIAANQARAAALSSRTEYCFPCGHSDARVLYAAIQANPQDGISPALLANLLYDRRRYQEAMKLWRIAVRINPNDSISWRNLGLGIFNIESNSTFALHCYSNAMKSAPWESRILYEWDQLAKRVGTPPSKRLQHLLRWETLIHERDDLFLEYIALLIHNKDTNKAQEFMENRRFQPWEGGEGIALGLWERLHLNLANQCLSNGASGGGVDLLLKALQPPHNLGEDHHLLANRSDLYLKLGDAWRAQNQLEKAAEAWEIATKFAGDFQAMKIQFMSEKSYFSILALKRLGKDAQANEMIKDLRIYATDQIEKATKIDYFATSLPRLLLFRDDEVRQKKNLSLLLLAQANLADNHMNLAKQQISEILKNDPNHEQAIDLWSEIEAFKG